MDTRPGGNSTSRKWRALPSLSSRSRPCGNPSPCIAISNLPKALLLRQPTLARVVLLRGDDGHTDWTQNQALWVQRLDHEREPAGRAWTADSSPGQWKRSQLVAGDQRTALRPRSLVKDAPGHHHRRAYDQASRLQCSRRSLIVVCVGACRLVVSSSVDHRVWVHVLDMQDVTQCHAGGLAVDLCLSPRRRDSFTAGLGAQVCELGGQILDAGHFIGAGLDGAGQDALDAVKAVDKDPERHPGAVADELLRLPEALVCARQNDARDLDRLW